MAMLRSSLEVAASALQEFQSGVLANSWGPNFDNHMTHFFLKKAAPFF